MKRGLFVAAAIAVAFSVNAGVTAWWRMNGTAGENASTVAPTIGTLSLTGAKFNNDGYMPVFQDSTMGDAYFLSRADDAVAVVSDANGSVRINGNHGSASGGQFSVSDSSNVLVGVWDATNAASFTVEAIMRVHSFSNAWTKVMQFSGGAAALLLELNGNGNGTLWQVGCDRFARNESNLAVTFNAMDGAWHHIAVTYDAATTNVAFYGDYVKVASCKVKYHMARTTGLTLGGSRFDGAFDEVRISEGVLSTNDFLTLASGRPANFFYPMNTTRSGAVSPANVYAASGGASLISSATALTGSNTGIHSYLNDPTGPMRNIPYAASFSAAKSSSFSFDRFSSASLEQRPFTLEVFACLDSDEGLIFKHGDTWSLGFEDGSFVFARGEDKTVLGAASAVADANWHHIAFAYGLSGETASYAVYVDGAAFGTISSTEPLPAGLASFMLGDGCTGRMFAFKGSEAALSPAQFLSFVEFPTDDAYAYWNLDSPDTTFEYFPAAVGTLGAVSGVQSLGLRGCYYGGYNYYPNDTEAAISSGCRPYLTNDVPCAYTWDEASGRIINPENETAVRFTNMDTTRVDCVNGSLVQAYNAGDYFPSNMTVELFVRQYFRPTFACMMNLGDQNNAIWMIDTLSNTDTPRTRLDLVGASNWNLAFSKGFGNNGWHHVALTIETTETGTKVMGYLDYTNRLSNSSAHFLALGKGTRYINIGSTCGRAWDGMIDEPRITKGILPPERFMRPFTPRADITGIWLADGVKGQELLSPETGYLTATYDAASVTASDELPFGATVVKVRGKSQFIPKSAHFTGASGLVVPCAAVVGSRDFTVEATVRGKGVAAAKARAFGKSWALCTTDAGLAAMRFDDVTLGAEVGVSTNVVASAVDIDDGDWHHVAMAVDRTASNTATLFVDGESVATADVSGMKIDAGDFEIGNGWTGEIVAVRYSPGVLAPADFLKVSPPAGTFLILR